MSSDMLELVLPTRFILRMPHRRLCSAVHRSKLATCNLYNLQPVQLTQLRGRMNIYLDRMQMLTKLDLRGDYVTVSSVCQ